MARAGFLGKRGLFWRLVGSWLIPAIMTGAYLVLMLTSDVDATGAAWESIGLAFVYVLWFMFRILTESAMVSRAIAVGDADRLLELADEQLARRRRAKRRAPMHVLRALARDMRGEWPLAIDELDAAGNAGKHAALAAVVRTSALVETGHVADARKLFDAQLAGMRAPRDMQIAMLGKLAEGRLRAAEGDRDGASQLLARLAEDVRAGSGIRERAKQLAARL